MSNLDNFAQLPMNVGMDPAQANAIPNPTTSIPAAPGTSSQPQYVTDLTRMLGVLTDNQMTFQQGLLQFLEVQQSSQPPPVQPSPLKLGGTVKVRNPRMFNGKHDEVTPFLSEVKRIIEFNSVSFPTDRHKVLFLGLYLKDGVPIEWFNHLENNNSPLLWNWPNFIQEFRKKFADPRLILTADQKLDQLKQTGSAHSYLTRFVEISSHLDMTEQTKISRFMKGLKPAIKDNLVSVVDRPTTLLGWENIIIQVDANLHQREIERRVESTKKPSPPPPNPKPSSSNLPPPVTTPTGVSPDVVPMEVDAVATGVPRGKLTAAERDYRVKNNLCLYCGKSGHSVNSCFARKAKHGDLPKAEKAQPKKN